MTKQADLPYAREIALYVDNTGELYRSRTLPIIRNLARKMNRGTYDAAMALKLWESLADAGARMYAREFGAELVNVATRKAAAKELQESNQEAVEDTAKALKEDERLRRVWTMSAIRYAVMQSGSHHFDAKTMKFFGETMKNYSRTVEGGVITVERCGGRAGYKRYVFNPATRELIEA